ncbi:hypothetical protein V6Z11_A05G413100 [Gossypium hirsutum]
MAPSWCRFCARERLRRQNHGRIWVQLNRCAWRNRLWVATQGFPEASPCLGPVSLP